MNRYALLFAAMLVASLAVPSSQSGNQDSSNTRTRTNISIHPAPNPELQGAEKFIDAFINLPVADQQPNAPKPAPASQLQPPPIQVLLATVPNPIETHLAPEFDHNIDALQDGLEDSGFLFDSAWIPWSVHPQRESYSDDQQEKKAKSDEDELPGILLFRKAGATKDSYDFGLVVFLITEKPTQGIKLEQVKSAKQIMADKNLHFTTPIRILGPTFSGSFPSLLRMVNLLIPNPDHVTDLLIRSGGVTGGAYASAVAPQMTQGGATVNIGSAHHDDEVWTHAAVDGLDRMGIEENEIAALSESESAFGVGTDNTKFQKLSDNPDESDADKSDADKSNPHKSQGSQLQKIYFPRDISSVRADYEKQGIFDSYSVQQPWRRSLDLKSGEATEGDTVRSFGGPETDAVKESILIGISEFIKSHGIRAVLVSATNEEDRYFLTQFIHARNSGVRVVIIGASRLFMRGFTAQFRGDLVVDDFPMLPRLLDWTGSPGCGKGQNRFVRTFPDQSSQGTYFAALDLTMQPSCFSPHDPKASADTYPWVSEYSAPQWAIQCAKPVLIPPIYTAALGGQDTWPLAADNLHTWNADNTTDKTDNCPDCKWQVHMPFTLFEYGSEHKIALSPQPPRAYPSIHPASSWIALFLILAAISGVYCYCFCFADPAKHSLWASFAPCGDWRFWLCKVVVPAVVFAAAFQVLAITIDMPKAGSSLTIMFWFLAESLTVASPLAIALCALLSARSKQSSDSPPDSPAASFLPTRKWQIVCFVPCVLAIFLSVALHFGHSSDASSILNTYREMHWDSGLSLVPTALIFLLALLVWTWQAGQGLAILEIAPPLPEVPENGKISDSRSWYMAKLGRPLTSAHDTTGLWVICGLPIGSLFAILFLFRQFRDITTLEARSTTVVLMCFGTLIASLILVDLFQFVWLWNRLKGMLRSLGRKSFKRSFVPVKDFTWRALWSFSGVSMRDRRRIEALQTDLVIKLAEAHQLSFVKQYADQLHEIRDAYNRVPLAINPNQYKRDRETFRNTMTLAGTEVYAWVRDLPDIDSCSSPAGPAQPIVICQCKDSDDRFADDRAEVARLDPRQRDGEKFLCLLYIGFIMTIVARLHSLLISMAAMFSLAALGFAIYPFAPMTPLAGAGLCLLALIAFAFYEVFSGLDTDPVMARIVNGDDRKLQWSFYGKFAESMAFPLLTLASTFLPGGASRLLDLSKLLFSHGQ